MIIALQLRYIKTYSGINYIPLTNGDSFCSLVGSNGIGKSSIMEALDCLLNERPWNINLRIKRSGHEGREPFIVPIFLINKNRIKDDILDFAEKISNCVSSITNAEINTQKSIFNIFLDQRESIKAQDNNENLIIPIGLEHDGKTISLGIFTKYIKETLLHDLADEVKEEKLEELWNEIKYLYEYIYIPKDIDPELFTQLETKEIQALMGESLLEIVEKCIPQAKIQEINAGLNRFVDNLSSKLGDYAFRSTGEKQKNVRKNDVYRLVIDAFFKQRKLHKVTAQNWLELGQLSSGEKQKAIIEIAYNLLKNYRTETQNLILAIDEPESSLHISSCYDQFEKLFEISQNCGQLIVATHWYGFIPTIKSGFSTVISKRDDEHQFDFLEIGRHRELIKQNQRSSENKLPHDINLKSINDFTQSVLSSVISQTPYNWIICEGSSEKIYLDEYLSDIKDTYRVRIIPVGGAPEVKRIYQSLIFPCEDLNKEMKGKIILIYDTDPELVQIETSQKAKKLICKRIVAIPEQKQVSLVEPNANPKSPKTCIEDALNGYAFAKTLASFKATDEDLAKINFEAHDKNATDSFCYLDLRASEKESIERFFNRDNNKFNFAKKYIETLSSESPPTPKWIEYLREEITRK
jgi:predicted ATPase